MDIPPNDKIWKRGDLEERGFYYNDNRCHPAEPFPRHVEALRQAIVDFTFGKDYDQRLIVCEKTVFCQRVHLFIVDGPADSHDREQSKIQLCTYTRWNLPSRNGRTSSEIISLNLLSKTPLFQKQTHAG